VHGIGAEVGGDVVAFFQDAGHPVAQAGGFGGGLQVCGSRGRSAIIFHHDGLITIVSLAIILLKIGVLRFCGTGLTAHRVGKSGEVMALRASGSLGLLPP
jgi:hypothetical protein